MGNPPLFPLVDETKARDLIIIRINPLERPEIPKTAFEIDDRLNEITFNASLFKELRSLAFLAEMIHEEGLEREAYRDTHLHSIAENGTKLGVESTFRPSFVFEESLQPAHLQDSKRKPRT